MRIILLCLSCFLFTGCISSPFQSTALSDKKELPPNHGIAVIQVVNNIDALAINHKEWTKLFAYRIDNLEIKKQEAIKKEKTRLKREHLKEEVDVNNLVLDYDQYSFLPTDKGLIDSQIFIGSLPEGTYRLFKLYSFFQDRERASWIHQKVESSGTFTVKKNSITNLETILFQPLKEVNFDNPNSKMSAYVSRIAQKENLDEYVTHLYPTLAKKLDLTTTYGWDVNELPSHKKGLNNLSREYAYGFQASRLKSNGTGAITAKLGQLRILTNDKKWQQISLPTNAQLTCIYEEQNLLAVGAERGQLFTKKEGDNEWKLSLPVQADEAILWIGKGNDKFYALTLAGNRYNTYAFDDIHQPWQRITRFSKYNSPSSSAFPYITEDGNLKVLYKGFNYKYSASKNKWKMSRGKSFVKVARMDNGILLGLTNYNDQKISTNDGKTWKDINREVSFWGDNNVEDSLPALINGDTLISVNYARVGKKKYESRIISNALATASDESAWKKHGQIKNNCPTLLPQLTSGNMLFFLCSDGKVVSTSDLGQSWQDSLEINLFKIRNEYETYFDQLKTNAE